MAALWLLCNTITLDICIYLQCLKGTHSASAHSTWSSNASGQDTQLTPSGFDNTGPLAVQNNWAQRSPALAVQNNWTTASAVQAGQVVSGLKGASWALADPTPGPTNSAQIFHFN